MPRPIHPYGEVGVRLCSPNGLPVVAFHVMMPALTTGIDTGRRGSAPHRGLPRAMV